MAGGGEAQPTEEVRQRTVAPAAYPRRIMTPPPPTRAGVPLKDRPTGNQSPPAATPRRRRHCWLTREDGTETEALVLQWAQDGAEWVALVAHVIPRPGGDLIAQEWAPATRLRPVK